MWGCPMGQGLEKPGAPGKQSLPQVASVGGSCSKVELATIIVTKIEQVTPRT